MYIYACICEYFYAEYMCSNRKVGFCISQIETAVLGNEANFTWGYLKILREIGKCNIYSMFVHTDILCTVYSAYTEDKKYWKYA